MTEKKLGPRPTRGHPMGAESGARWCDTHEKWECTKNRTKGRGTCHQPAISGTAACRTHSGKKTSVAKLQGVAKIQAHRNITAWNARGEVPSIDHQQIALATLQMSWLRLGTYSELVRQQVAVEGERAGALEEDNPKASGLIGYEYGAAGKDGTIFAKSEQVRALVRLESEERDRVMKYTKQCHDMGISDRLTSLAERWGDIVANRITKLLAALDLTPEQATRAPALIIQHLGVIELGGPET